MKYIHNGLTNCFLTYPLFSGCGVFKGCRVIFENSYLIFSYLMFQDFSNIFEKSHKWLNGTLKSSEKHTNCLSARSKIAWGSRGGKV